MRDQKEETLKGVYDGGGNGGDDGYSVPLASPC